MAPESALDFYLSRVGDELVLNFGKNPVEITTKSKRIIVIGGGVTGMTVSQLLLQPSFNV